MEYETVNDIIKQRDTLLEQRAQLLTILRALNNTKEFREDWPAVSKLIERRIASIESTVEKS